MVEIALFHSVHGVRPGVVEAAERFRAAGHSVHVLDLYEGKSFDDYDAGFRFVEEIGGISELIDRSQASVTELPHELVYAGFSNGGGSAELLAATRPGARGALLFHAALPVDAFGIESWPARVPVQVHYGVNDPFRAQEAIDSLADSVKASKASFEYFEYQTSGHLFTDRSLPAEYDEESTEALFAHALQFLDRVDHKV